VDTHVEENESRADVIAEEEEGEQDQEQELEFKPQRKLWTRTDTSTSLPFETQGSTIRVSVLLDERPPSEFNGDSI
jgi:hypothetical protein